MPKTLDEKSTVAHTCAANLKLTLPVVVDGTDNKVGNAYSGWPDRIYVVGADGKIGNWLY